MLPVCCTWSSLLWWQPIPYLGTVHTGIILHNKLREHGNELQGADSACEVPWCTIRTCRKVQRVKCSCIDVRRSALIGYGSVAPAGCRPALLGTA